MLLLRNILSLLCVFLLTQCASTTPSRPSSPGGSNARVDTTTPAVVDNSTLEKGCPFEKVQWLYASKDFDSTRQNALAKGIIESAQTDAATLDRLLANKNNNPLVISSALKAYVEKMAATRTPVSDEFYKQYVNSRMTMCAVIDALRDGSVKADESSKVASNTFKDVIKSFEKLKI
jgi:hypothetical protein